MLSITVISCSDSDKSVNQNFDGQPLSFGGSYNNLWNPVNPYDSIGYMHNEIGDYVINQYVSSTGAASFGSSVTTHISNYCDSVYSITVLPAALISSNEAHFQLIIDAIDSNQTFEEYLYEQFSSNIAYSLNQLFQTMATCSTSNQVDATINQIKLLENSVSSNLTYSQHEKKVVFSATAVSKFSLVYWDDAINNPNNGWNIWKEDYDNEENPEWIGWYTAAGATIMDALTAAKAIDDGSPVPVVAYRSLLASYGVAVGNLGGVIGAVVVAVTTILSWLGF
ncbi:MAG: hypothetical protein KIT33_11875 [Candidatus Kapabacteria bacterium]|nr:hypothetical protein [Ignavibacteriota bacterium]MCW5885658.1 hypothetical protein [Candidatus Kapabacteria bacterium]